MADHIREVFNLEATLKKSDGGRFEVYYDGERIFSKAKTFRFPTKDEIVNLIKERMN
ncbi:MAG TPA: hypothetical protein ENJ89_02070 [Caldithrix abyssi]|uniref:SelT/SelW/SelH family protein n=1 Tax=Caldithrix abyssi TaxID=187145 RepID=A0A7V5UE17_CALAY|nr:hypothetical protein [Caldithrix abyssi]